jgi:hypothetical protein
VTIVPLARQRLGQVGAVMLVDVHDRVGRIPLPSEYY